MFADNRIVFLGFHFLGMQALVLRGRVEMTGTGGRDEFDFVTHDYDLRLLDALAFRAHIRQHLVDAVLIDVTQALMGQAQPNKALLGLYPEPLGLQVWQETPTRSVIRMRNVVTALRALPGHHTNSGHCFKSLYIRMPARSGQRAELYTSLSAANQGWPGDILPAAKEGRGWPGMCTCRRRSPGGPAGGYRPVPGRIGFSG